MATGTMTEQTSQWLLSTQLKNSTQTITLSTAKKYIKKDIKLDITTQAAKTAAGVAVGDTVIYDGTNDTDINPNLIKLNGLQAYSSATIVYNQATNTYTITNPASPNTSWGSGVSIKQDGTIVPYGSDYRVSMEVYVPTQSSYSVDVNNSVQSGTAWSGNDNDLTSSRTTASGTIPANQWVTISWGSKNAHASNTSKTGLIVCDGFGTKTANMVWYVRNPKMEIGTNITSWVPSVNDTNIVNLGSKVTLTSGTGSKYYIPLKTTGSGYTKVTQKGWIEEGNKDKAEVINTNYINIPEATFQNITATTNTSKVQLVSAEGYTEGKYISALTIPAKKTLDTLTLTAGDSSERTYLSTLNVYGYTTVSSISLGGIITTITAGGGYIGTANLNNANSYIGNVYGTGYIRTNSGSTLAKYTQNGTLTTYEGSGGITNYSNTGTITNMTGSRTITNLGTSSTAGTLNITTNTYGTINVWGGKTKDKGVTIANHVVTVDGDGTNAGTAVTNSSGDLITTSLSFSGGTPSITGNSNSIAVTGMATSDTATNYYVKATAKAKATRTAVNYTNATAGWLSAHASATQASASATSAESSFDSAITYIKGASASVTASVGPKPTIANLTSAVSGKTQISATPSTDANTIGTYYIAVRANSPATAITFTRTVDQAGYLSSNTQIGGSSNSTSTNGDTYYIPLKSGTLANSATTSVTYAENTSIAVPSQGALYINAGYYPNTMITLDQMLDGKTDTAGTAAGQILSGYVAYDVDGKKLTGTMVNNTNNFTTLTGSNNSATNGGYNITSTGIMRVCPPTGFTDYGSTSWDNSLKIDVGTATAAEVLSGKTFTSSAGRKVSGTMPNNGALGTTAAPKTITSQNGTYTIPAGYTTGGVVKATINDAVFATNITTASSGGVPLVSTAGYTGTKNLTAVTIAAGKTLGSASAAGVTLSAKDTSNNISQMYVTMNTGSKIYVTDANSGKTWIIESDSINNSLNIWQE